MTTMLERSLLALGLLLVGGAALAQTVPNAPTGRIEQIYYEPGPWTVARLPAVACCDSSGYAFDLWYPASGGPEDLRLPMLSWGNGTGAAPENYDYLLSHLASWGFAVIASRDPNTGSGQEMLDALAALAAMDADPQSPLYGRLASARAGVLGHSQGATGALNALAQSGGTVQTAIPIELPAQRWCSEAISCADSRQLSQGSVFYVNGSADTLISPSTQMLPWQRVGLQSNAAYYQATPASLDKAFATLIGPDHNDVQGQPDCAQAAQPCVNGVYGYLGYPTAWLLDQLRDDAQAHRAFITQVGEIFFQDSNWQNQTSNLRP